MVESAEVCLIFVYYSSKSSVEALCLKSPDAKPEEFCVYQSVPDSLGATVIKAGTRCILAIPVNPYARHKTIMTLLELQPSTVIILISITEGNNPINVRLFRIRVHDHLSIFEMKSVSGEPRTATQV